MSFSTSFDQAFSGNGRALPPPGSAPAELKNNIQLALTRHLPQLMSLTEAVVDGIDRAYELDVNPNKTANEYASLALITSQFYDFLRETGIGALPMTDMETTSTTATSTGQADATALDLVTTESIQTSNAISKKSEDELRTSLDSTVNTQYLRERRVADNALIQPQTEARLVRLADVFAGGYATLRRISENRHPFGLVCLSRVFRAGHTLTMTYPRIIGGASLLVALSLHQKTTLIIGAGRLAAVRAAAALQADSRVIIVVQKQDSGEYEEEIKIRWERGEIEVVEFDKDVEGETLEPLLDTFGRVSVAFVTDTLIGSPRRRGLDSAVGVCKALKKRNILVNVADQPSLCDFTLPACHRFNYTLSGSSTNPSAFSPTTSSAMAPSSLQIAITTNGKGCRLAGRIRREIITKLPENIGDAVENLSALRQAAKGCYDLSEENEDSLSSTPNNPVPQRRLGLNPIVGDSTVVETAEEAQRRRMRWVAQISEFWPLERLAALDAQQREDVLRDAIHEPQVILQSDCEQVSTIPPSSPVRSAISHHKLDMNRSGPLPPKGRIYLLGSGPGHAGLLTVAAHDILTKKATLVLSDKLVPAEVLALIPSNITVKIAKKFPGNADGAQSEMMLEAVEAAGRGETVVRLKQGDPMVYGRAGEEVLYFRQHGYESVVIPGLSSAISGPTLAGIPVTQRGVAESVVLCTGVGRGGRGTRLPGYQRERTLILLMGVARLEELIEALVSAGEGDHGVATDKGRRDGAPYPRNLPIAIIERASMSDQRVISSTLATIALAMKSAAVGEQRPPGMIVVGWSVLALVGAGDVTVLDDATSNSTEDLAAVDERRVHRWLGDAGWTVKEGIAKWD